eukprot:2674419-Amphidinium_carterae.1
MPSYLQTLHVTMEASLLTGSLWKNLALGRQYWARTSLAVCKSHFTCLNRCAICLRTRTSRENMTPPSSCRVKAPLL